MKCHRCKGDGRQVTDGRWVVCDLCHGTGEAAGADLKLMDAIISAGYSHGEAADIVAKGTGIPEAPTYTLGQAVAVSAPFSIGQDVRGKSNGQEMVVTAIMGDEVACEWITSTPTADGGTVDGMASGVFSPQSLEPVNG